MSKFLKSISKHKRLIGIIAIILIGAIVVPIFTVPVIKAESEQPAVKGSSANLVFAQTIKENPELATANGVRGIIEIGLADWPESGAVFASRGERVTIPIFISFTSYDPDLKSLDVLIDPSGKVGLQRWQYWYEYDAQGKAINRGAIHINDLISYDKGGTVTIEAGGRVEFSMFIDIPSDLPPLKTESVMLAGCGIWKDDKEQGILFADNIVEEVKLK